MRRVGITFGVTFLLAATLPTHAELTKDRQRELQRLLTQDCGSCHGLTMKGGLGSPLLPESLKDKPDIYLKTVILEGMPGKPMPPWRGLLSEEDVDHLIALMRKGPNP